MKIRTDATDIVSGQQRGRDAACLHVSYVFRSLSRKYLGHKRPPKTTYRGVTHENVSAEKVMTKW